MLPSRPTAGLLLALCAVVLAVCTLPAWAADEADETKEKVYWLKIEGQIGRKQERAVERLYERAKDEGVKTVIIELDTPGGYVEQSFRIADTIYRRDRIRTIAYVHGMALSGGTIIALAADEVYMAPGAQIGDVAPIDPAQRGVILGEKIQSPVRSKLRTFAKARGYPVALTDAMVSKDLEVFRVKFQGDPEPRFMSREEINNLPEVARQRLIDKKLIVAAGNLLTLDAAEAQEYGFSKTVRGRPELLEKVGVEESQITMSAGSRIGAGLQVLNALVPVMLIAGLVLLFFEFATPGFAIPGISGCILLVLVFVTKSYMGTASAVEILMFIVGLGLIAIEVFVTPGFGIIGVSGLVCTVGGLVLSFQDFGWPTTETEWSQFAINLVQVIGSLVLSIILMGVLAKYFVRVPLFNRLVLTSDLATSAAEADAAQKLRQGQLIGRVGVAVTPLRPCGRVSLDGEIVDAVTDGEFIETGSLIKVLDSQGMRTVVTTVEPEELEASEQESAT